MTSKVTCTEITLLTWTKTSIRYAGKKIGRRKEKERDGEKERERNKIEIDIYLFVK